MKQSTVRLSIPQAREVRGYEIKRLPLGPMLVAIEDLQELPGDLLRICFPGEDPAQILQKLKKFDAEMLLHMLGNALTEAPKHIIHLFAGLSGIPEKDLLEDPNVGFDGIVELMDAWIEVANVQNFTTAARALAAKLKTAAGSFRLPTTGSNVLSQPPKA